MESEIYYLLRELDRPVIIHEETGLRVNVFDLINPFTPVPGQLHIFGEVHGEWLAFETEDWGCESLSLISAAVLWYAVQSDYPQMQVAITDPRPKCNLKVC